MLFCFVLEAPVLTGAGDKRRFGFQEGGGGSSKGLFPSPAEHNQAMHNSR